MLFCPSVYAPSFLRWTSKHVSHLSTQNAMYVAMGIDALAWAALCALVNAGIAYAKMQ